MNQILITQKLYVTPELRRKKKIYKFEFFIAILLLCLLFSYYIYAEYDRTASEEVSREILAGMQISDDETVDNTIRQTDNNVIIVAIEDDEDGQMVEMQLQQTPTESIETSTGTYKAEAVLAIPRLGINYPVLSETSDELLKISINKYWGPKPNEIGNYCVVGHNYKNKKMFGRLNEAVNGDIIQLTDNSKRTISYEVYDKYVVKPTDTSCTSQLTNGRRELTLITCTNYGQERLVVKAKQK